MSAPHSDDALAALMRKAAQIENEIDIVRVRSEAAAGQITVEVDATGAITDLHIAEQLLGMSTAAQFAQAIADAQRTACAQARQIADDLKRTLTDDPYAAAVFKKNAETSLSALPPGPTASPQRQPDNEIVDWEEEERQQQERIRRIFNRGR